MGICGYGTAGLRIPDGYLPIRAEIPDGQLIDQEITYPANPGSIYHTKDPGSAVLPFLQQNARLKVTDLN